MVGNVFRMYETKGVPLETIIQKFDELNYLIDWIDFYESSIQSGWNVKTTLKKIEYSLIDTKGKDYTTQVLTRLKFYITKRT